MFYEKHQKKKSPFVELDIPCVTLFVLDYMHLVCLGVTKRILRFLKKGPAVCRLSQTQLNMISDHLISMKDSIPSNFSRKPRPLLEMDRWKATEYRQFLLYTGPVVLKKVLAPKHFTHFLTLRMGIAILLNSNDPERNAGIEYANNLLQYFVRNACLYYGDIFNVYNVHNLVHIASDVKNLGCPLDDISCFQFENYLQSLKRKVKNANNPVVQITKKCEEGKHVGRGRKCCSKIASQQQAKR